MHLYLPNAQSVLVAGLALSGISTNSKTITDGSVLDYAVEKCIDADNNVRCTKPFLVSDSGCYNIEWSTDGVLSHTTAEVRDAGSNKLVFYRDTNGEWKPEKKELVYMDFKPKIPGTGNSTIEYKVTTCDKDDN